MIEYARIKLINNDLEVAHPHSGSSSTWLLVELEFRHVGLRGEGKTAVPGETPLGARERTNNKLNPHMASTPGFEPGPHTLVGGECSHHYATLAPQKRRILSLHLNGRICWIVCNRKKNFVHGEVKIRQCLKDARISKLKLHSNFIQSSVIANILSSL